MEMRDIMPPMLNGRHTATFKHGMTRKQELLLREELCGMTKRSLAELAAKKEGERNTTPNDTQKAIKTMLPEFKPQRVLDKRKTHPIFHDDLKPKSTRVKTPKCLSGVPPYNCLEREESEIKLKLEQKTNKYPFNKEQAITTEDMKKPHVSSVGVTPARESAAVQTLKVLMEGKAVQQSESDPVLGPIQRANSALLNESRRPQMENNRIDVTSEEAKRRRPNPAIVAATGTLRPVQLTERPPPLPKPKTRLRPIKSARPDSASSTGSGVQDEGGDSEEGSKPSSADPNSRNSSAHSVKSVKELLEEAKQLATPGENEMRFRHRALIMSDDTKKDKKTLKIDKRGKSGKSVKSTKTASVKSDAKDELKTKERTVDQIIASLKDPSRAGGVSEADKKIQEIMQRVLSRTAEVLGTDVGSDVPDMSTAGPVPTAEPFDDLVAEIEDEDTSSRQDKTTTGESTDIDILESTDMQDTEIDTERTGQDDGTTISQTETGMFGSQVAPSEPPAVIQEALMCDATGSDLDLLVCSSPRTFTNVYKDWDAKHRVDMEQLAAVGAGSVAPKDGGEFKLDLSGIGLTQSEPGEPTPDLKQAWEDLCAPHQVHYEDILNITAQPVPIHAKSMQAQNDVMPPEERPASCTGGSTFLSTWMQADGEPRSEVKDKVILKGATDKSIHHFCTVTDDVQLPDHFRGVWRRYHVPSKVDFIQKKEEGRPRVTDPDLVENHSTASEREKLSRIQSAAAQRILNAANEVKGTSEDSLEQWATRAHQVFDVSEMAVDGKKMDIKTDESFLYWTPAPPKWDVPPQTVKAQLFPGYHGAALATEQEGSKLLDDEVMEEEEEEQEETDSMDPEDRMARDRVLARNYGSATDLTSLMVAVMQREEAMEGSQNLQDGVSKSTSLVTMTTENDSSSGRAASGRVRGGLHASDLDSISEAVTQSDLASLAPAGGPISFADLRARFSMAAACQPEVQAPQETPDCHIFPVFLPLKRRNSAPGALVHDDDDYVMVFEDYNVVMEDLRKQRQQLKDIKEGRREPPKGKDEETEEGNGEKESAQIGRESEEAEVDTENASAPERLSLVSKKKATGPTPAELALEAGRAYVLLPQKKKKKRKAKPLDIARIEALERFLAQNPCELKRTESVPQIEHELERELRVPKSLKCQRRSSIPASFDFEQYAHRKGYRPQDWENSREFVRDIWNHWFDQVYPPTPPESEWDDDESTEPEEVEVKEDKTKRRASVSTVYSENMEVEPIIEDEEDEMAVEMLEEEVTKLSQEMDSTDKPKAFDLARRGALLRKLGRLKGSLADLSKAIDMEPLLLNAYWHRHLLYLLQNNRQKALEDLNVLLKHAKNNAGAYRSRAAIYRQAGDLTMAIVNFTQAIKLNPDDHEAYYQRAEMYEKRGEMLLAMEDYALATKLMPSKTEALFRHGLHYFKNGNWQAAINDFTELLKVEPSDGKARMYRGRAYSKMRLWNQAVEDLSAAVHLDPQNYLAFYYRACILRKVHPKRALQDFSVSLLINNTEDNILSYLHRGILYNDVGRHEDAIPDFEAVLKLDKDMAVAHVNLGLVYMLRLENYHRAVKKFTAAIKADPTYIKAYICRAECYTRVHDIKNALLDFTRAIHLQPGVGHYYMYRGQLVLRTGNLELAAFCVRHAAELNAGLGQSPTQQAIVQSFLKNYDKAVEALEGATKIRPVAPLFVLLGKTQMKARHWKEAVQSFSRALDIVKPWQDSQTWPQEAAEMNYLIGMCQVEIRNYLGAHDAFNNAIRVDPKYAEAFYQRGLVRMKLKQSKGIQDFNRALALNPKLFQAYLSRAAYYGLRGNYTKAILNCNEAIKLQPNSVRAYLYRGALKYHIKAYVLAIRDLTKAATIDNTCSLAYFNRAVCYHDSGKWQKALQDYGIVLLLGEQLMLKVLINRGLLYFSRNDYRNALHDFSMAAKVNPRDKKIHHTLGLCYHKLWQLEKAVKSFSRSIDLDQFCLDAYIGRGNVFMDYGHNIGHMYAKRDYERALRLDPCCVTARVNLGYNLQVAGRYQLAWHQFSAAININPSFKPALEGRAIINLQMSNTFAAFQDIHASVHVAPTAELLTNRGVIYQFMNDRVNAMRDYQQALKLDPTYALAYFNAANVYFHTRQFKQAIAYFNQAITYNPKDESAFLNRAITKVMLRDGRSAMEDFDKAVAMSPHSAHIYFNRGNLFASMKQWSRAEEDYSKALELQPEDALVLKRRADVRGKLGKKEIAIKDYQQAIEIQSAKVYR